MGTYVIAKNKIIIYPKWGGDNICKSIAIHEYAHHLHHTEKGLFTNDIRKKDRAHGEHFWCIYSFLMVAAFKK